MKIIDAIGVTLIAIGVAMTFMVFLVAHGPAVESDRVLIRGNHYYVAPPERPL